MDKTEIINKILETVENVKDFSLEQSNLYIQELIKFTIIWNSLIILTNLVIIIVAPIIVYKAYKFAQDNLVALLACILLPVIFFINVLILGDSSYKLTKAYCAPRVFLVDTLRSMR